jgi:phospholipid N-methyltransferase
MDQNGMSNSHRGPSIDASYHVSAHLDKLFQSRRFLEIDQSETKIACGGHVCEWIGKKMSNLYRELSIDASYQVSVHLAKQFQRTRFLEIDQSEIRIAYGSHIC